MFICIPFPAITFALRRSGKMSSCPRSCPSRRLDPSEVATIDKEEDRLPPCIVQNVHIWMNSHKTPLQLNPFDVASYNSDRMRFQEYEKSRNEFRYQLQNGMNIIEEGKKRVESSWCSVLCHVHLNCCDSLLLLNSGLFLSHHSISFFSPSNPSSLFSIQCSGDYGTERTVTKTCPVVNHKVISFSKSVHSVCACIPFWILFHVTRDYALLRSCFSETENSSRLPRDTHLFQMQKYSTCICASHLWITSRMFDFYRNDMVTQRKYKHLFEKEVFFILAMSFSCRTQNKHSRTPFSYGQNRILYVQRTIGMLIDSFVMVRNTSASHMLSGKTPSVYSPPKS